MKKLFLFIAAALVSTSMWGSSTTIFSFTVDDSGSDVTVARNGGSVSLTTSNTFSSLSGGTVSVTNVNTNSGGPDKVVGIDSKERHIRFTSTSQYLAIVLSTALSQNDTIQFTSNGSAQIAFTLTSARATTISTTSNKYVIPTNSTLIGATTIYVHPASSSTKIKTFSIKHPDATDQTGPTLSTSVPANEAADVAISGNIVLTFDEDATINDASKFTLTGGTGTLNTASASVSGAAVTIPYSGLAYSTEYTLTIAADAVKDGWNNKNTEESNIVFTTVAEPATAAPEFTTPASEPDAAEYAVGATISALEVAVTGYPEPTLQWYSNTSKSTTGATELTGEDGDSYTPSNAATSDLYYYCVATNSAGSAQSYYFHVTITEDNTLLVKVVLSGDNGSTQTLSGTARANAEASVQALAKSSPYKLNNNYKSYVALTLTSGYFQKGDSVVIDHDKHGAIYCGTLPASDASAVPAGATSLGTTTKKDDIEYFILPESLPKNTTTIFTYRPNSDYNGKLTYMAVYRLPDPGETTALDNTADEAKAVKFFKDGQIFIEKNGHLYNVLGGRVK